MVEIIAFPGRSSSSVVDTSSLNLQGSLNVPADPVAPLPQVGATLDGTLVMNAPSEADAFPEGDWTNQELADLYRVESLLVQAGIKMSTGRGVTDENDPWFVFCREDGDVFVHLARADGRYLLDSPGLSGLLEGSDFNSLIDQFVQQLAALRKPDEGSNVVSFRPRMLKDKHIHLHPSVLLAALIWTLYLASDDFASATEAASDLADDAILPVDQLLSLDNADGADAGSPDIADISGDVHEADAKLQKVNPSAGLTAHGPQDTDRSGQGPDRQVTGFSAMAANFSPAAQAVSASLAIIAFSYGFYGPKAGKDSDTDFDAGSALDSLQSALSQLAEFGAVSTRPDADQVPSEIDTGLGVVPVVLETLDAGIPLQIVSAVDYQLHLDDLTQETTASNDLPASDGFPMADDQPVHSAPVEETRARTVDTATASGDKKTASTQQEPATASESPSEENQPGPTQQVSAPADPEAQSDTVMTLVMERLNSASSYEVDGATVSATLDEDGLDKVLGHLEDLDLGFETTDDTISTADLNDALKDPVDGLDDVTIDPIVPETGGGPATGSGTDELSVIGAKISQFNATVDYFMQSFYHNSDSVQIVHFNSELVFFDMTAIDDATDRAYARSWVMDDGLVVSVVGHYQDFIDYGMA